MNNEQANKLKEIADVSNSYSGKLRTIYSEVKSILLALEAHEIGLKSKDMI